MEHRTNRGDIVPPTTGPAAALADGGMYLRPWQPRDGGVLVEAVHESLTSVGRWLPWCHAGYDMAEADAWIAHCRAGWTSGDEFAFGVFDQASDELLGGVGLSQRNRTQRSANLGYCIRQSCQGRGLAARAAGLAVRFGFERLGLVRIEIIAMADNRASRRTAEKLGARFEAMAPQRLRAWDRAWDAAVYGLVPADLELPPPSA